MMKMKCVNDWAVLNNISLLLEKKGMSIKVTAESIGISRTTLSRFLNGKSSLKSEHLISLFKVLGINLKSILNERAYKEKFNQENKVSSMHIGNDMEHLLKKFNKNERRIMIKDILATTKRYVESYEDYDSSFFRLKEYLRTCI